ncbi:hypothetical protein OBBRIDRAFT_255906 [Obba rivulosa]|uniref:Secreted protein n=1 Tax=Obba rivulosa TaxID=1052685 RepID=A0A8E2DGR3_9APHY|nr:hypothetical protein OBBRIDRAFT_255906 [Obba rivulosa]
MILKYTLLVLSYCFHGYQGQGHQRRASCLAANVVRAGCRHWVPGPIRIAATWLGVQISSQRATTVSFLRSCPSLLLRSTFFQMHSVLEV